MTPKLFYGLTVTAAICAVVAGTTYYSTRTWAPSTEQGQPLFPDLAANAGKVASVTVQQGGETVTISRNGDTWGIKDRAGWPADIEEVREAIVGLTRMEIVEEKTRNEERYALLHLEDPATEDAQSKLVRLADEGGNSVATVVLGKIKFGVLGPGRNGTYVRVPDNAQTWLVSGSIDAPIDVRGWAQKEIFEIPKEDVTQIRISHPDNEDVVLTRSEVDATQFALANVPEGAKLREDADITFIANSVAQLELWDVKKADEITEDANKTIINEIIARNGLTVFVNVVASEGENHWVTVEAQGVDAAKQAADEINARAGGWAFKIQSYKADNFRKRLSDLTEEAKPEGDS